MTTTSETNFIVNPHSNRFNNGSVIAYRVLPDGIIEVGGSICAKTDTFDEQAGKAHAEARLNNPADIGYSQFNIIQMTANEIAPQVVDGCIAAAFGADDPAYSPFNDNAARQAAIVNSKAVLMNELAGVASNIENYAESYIRSYTEVHFTKTMYYKIKPFLRRKQKRALAAMGSIFGINLLDENTPNAKTQSAIAELEAGEGQRFETVEDLVKDLEATERKAIRLDVGNMPPEAAMQVVTDAIQRVPF